MELKDLLLQPDESQRALDLADEPDLPLAVADAFAENPDEDVVALVPKSPPKPLKPLKDGELVLLDLCCFEPFFLLLPCFVGFSSVLLPTLFPFLSPWHGW